MKIQSTTEDTISLYNLPDNCPFCFRSITPFGITCHLVNERELEVYFVCNSKYCSKSFISYYERYSGEFRFMNSQIGNKQKRTFAAVINTLSPTFEKICNEAYFAEQNELFEICGVGYRKALEFLIKDYAINKYPQKRERIEKDPLSSCISQYISDEKIKSVAKRATWLGNDETHYVRKWETKDLGDLKKLIDVTLHWIEMEQLTSSFIEEMPE